VPFETQVSFRCPTTTATEIANMMEAGHTMSGLSPNTFDCLVLSGGGFKGAYGAGAAKALTTYYDLKGKRQICFIGTSAGALNAAVLAAGGADELLGFWRTVTAEDVLGTHTKSFFFQFAASVLRDRLSKKAPFSLYSNANLRRLIQSAISLAKLTGKHLIVTATNFTSAQARAFFSRLSWTNS
jgi:predicted acylesterase/phospholipase RssA